MRRAQAQAGVGPDDVDAVVAHATSTPKGDQAEISALNQVFGDRRRSLVVTSLKGNVGHTGAASGAMSVLAALHALNHGILSHIPTSQDIEDEVQFDVPVDAPATGDYGVIQVNAFGFGGQDTSLVLQRA